MNRCVAVGFAAVLVVVASSCGYFAHGTSETIQVTSVPSGASVVVSDGQTGTTPFSIVARRDQGLVFHFSMPGYQSVDIADETGMPTSSKVGNGVSLASVAAAPFSLPLFASSAVDDATGADRAHQTNVVSAHLEPIGAASPTAAPSSSTSAWTPPTSESN